MTKKKIARWAKGTAVSAVVAVTCCWTGIHLRDWAEAAVLAGEGTIGPGWAQTLLAEVVTQLSMPVLLWAGMRILRERGNHALVIGGLAAWFYIGGTVIHTRTGTMATAWYLALFVAIGSALSIAEFPSLRAPRPAPDRAPGPPDRP